jgi:hypothetical protein
LCPSLYCRCIFAPFYSKIDRRVDKTLLVSLMSLLILCEEEADDDERQRALASVNAQVDTGQIAYHRGSSVASTAGRHGHKKASTVTWAADVSPATDVHNHSLVPPCTCAADMPPSQSTRTHLLNIQLQTSLCRTDGAPVTQCGIDCGTATDVWTRWS